MVEQDGAAEKESGADGGQDARDGSKREGEERVSTGGRTDVKGVDGSGFGNGGKAGDKDAASSEKGTGEGCDPDHPDVKPGDDPAAAKGSDGANSGKGDTPKDEDASGRAQEAKNEAGDGEHQEGTKPVDEAATKGGAATASEGGIKRESEVGAENSKSSDTKGGETKAGAADAAAPGGPVEEQNDREKTDRVATGVEKKESGEIEVTSPAGEGGDAPADGPQKEESANGETIGASAGDNAGEISKEEADGEGTSADGGAANGKKGGVGGDGGKAPSDAGSNESSFFEEEPDELEVDLDKPWEKPSIEHAKKMRKRMIWNNGMRHYFGTSIKEIGSMGVGMYLYFWMIRIVAIMFAFCTIFSIPAMFLNQQGNGGMAIPETDIDSLGLVTLSYGNQGLNEDLTVESECISNGGMVDCTGKTVQVMGEAEDVRWVGFILVGGEAVIAFFFLFFIVALSERLKAKIDEIDDANVTPGDYSVMVRGFPGDVTKEEVRKHFSDLYSLVTPGPSYPFLGVSTTGVGIFWGCTLGLLFGVLVSPSVVEHADLGTGPSAFGAGLVTVFLCMILVYATVEGCGIGGPRKRDTPLMEWEKGRKQRARDKKKNASKYSAPPGKVLPVEANPGDNVGVEGAIAKQFDRSGAVTTADGGAGEVAKLEQGGIVVGAGGGIEPLSPLVVPGVPPPTAAELAVEEPHRSFDDGRPPDPLPCQSCLNTRDKSFIGSWVSDVVLGNPVGDVLMGFMDQEENIQKIGKARTVVRQMKTLGKAKKLAKAEAKLAKLKAKEEALMAATRKKQDPAALDSISVAFVTFEHVESKRRCLEDYRYSRRGFCRRFQPAKLQFSRMPAEDQQDENHQASPRRRGRKKRPRVQRWRLKVFQAPEPSDVKWENLDVTPTSRKLRRAFTSLVCVVLLIFSFIIIWLAQTEQAKLQDQMPKLSTCEEAIPAVVFGTYDFPLGSALQRNERMDSTCAEGSFYLAYTNSSDSNDAQLDYDNLPPVFSADGTYVPRVAFEEDGNAELCDDPCQPTSGGRTCRALSCYEESWQHPNYGYDCESYPQSTMVGCFCLDAVVTSLEEHGILNGAKKVASEQGAVCAPFLRDYAKANVLKILAVLSVVIVNTLLTSVMAKLAKFERHVSLSDYISTVTAKLALAQFLNTALIVIIVNAGYTGGGLGLLQDFGILDGEYKDFERSWYATVGVAVAMTMLINVVVPHAQTLVGEIIVKPVKRLFKRRSVATQAEMDKLYKPPKFDMESRYAFLLQVLGVSLLYSGGIPVLYLFACFSFATNFIVDKLWIIKLAQQPPMYTAALAKMFVGVLPLALLLHMSTTTYMLGNKDILNIGFVSEEAEAIADALQGQGVSGLVADHVLREHVFPLFVLTALFVTVYVVYKIVGDPVLQLVKLVLRGVFKILFGWMCKRKAKKIIEQQQQTPGKTRGYTAEFFRLLKKSEKIDTDEKKMGWVECVENGNRVAKWICTEDGPGPRGVKYKSGVPRQTWQVIAELGQYNYAMEESDQAGMATRYMATAGFLSPRMKEREKAKMKKTEKSVSAEEGVMRGVHSPEEAPAQGADVTASGDSPKGAPASSSEEKQQDGLVATADEKEDKTGDAVEKQQEDPASPPGGAEEKTSTAASCGEEKPADEGEKKEDGPSAIASGGAEKSPTVASSGEERIPPDADFLAHKLSTFERVLLRGK
eukprot:g10515.t1